MDENIKATFGASGQSVNIPVQMQLIAANLEPFIGQKIADGKHGDTGYCLFFGMNGDEIYLTVNTPHPDQPASYQCHWKFDIKDVLADALTQVLTATTPVKGKRQALLDALNSDWLCNQVGRLRDALQSKKATLTADYALAGLPEEFKNIVSIYGVDDLDQLTSELAAAVMAAGTKASARIRCKKDRKRFDQCFSDMAKQLPDFVRACVGGNHE
jgi:hypothetical protein